MSVNLVLPPTRPDADVGFLVMQADRCHAMSGSNAMCVVTVLLERVALEFVPSFVEHLGHALEVEGIGTLPVDVAYGGDYFCLANAAGCGFCGTARRGPRHGRAGREDQARGA
jgi:proline racemase